MLFLSRFRQKTQISLFKLKFGTESNNSNLLNSMVKFICPALE